MNKKDLIEIKIIIRKTIYNILNEVNSPFIKLEYNKSITRFKKKRLNKSKINRGYIRFIEQTIINNIKDNKVLFGDE